MPDLESLRESTLWLFLYEHRTWVGPCIAGIAFVESLALAGIAVPGVLMLATAALIAGGAGLSLWHTLAFAFVGAVAGDAVSFALGRALGPRLDHLWPLTRYPQWIDSGERFFRRHGDLSIVLGRFVGPLRPLIPLLAGSFGFGTRRFLAINMTSAVAWAPTYILPGYLLGASVAHELKQPDGLIIGLLVLATWAWLGGRLVARAWRLGAADSPLGDNILDRLDRLGLMRPLLASDPGDTRASLLLGGATATVLLIATLLVMLLAPGLAAWRSYLLDLARLTLQLL